MEYHETSPRHVRVDSLPDQATLAIAQEVADIIDGVSVEVLATGSDPETISLARRITRLHAEEANTDGGRFDPAEEGNRAERILRGGGALLLIIADPSWKASEFGAEFYRRRKEAGLGPQGPIR